MAVALIVRVVVVLASPVFLPRADAADFDRIAVSLVQHGTFATSYLTAEGGPTAFRPPLFPLALAGVYELTGTGSPSSRWEAGRMLEAALGAVAVLLIALIATRLWGLRVGLTAGAAAAVYPPLVLAGTSLLSESLFIPLVLGAVLAALVHRDSPHRLRGAAVSGCLIGLAALTRGNGIFLAIPLAFLVSRRRSSIGSRSWQAPAALLACAIVILVPWTIRNWAVFGRFVPVSTETGYILAGTYNNAIQHQQPFPALWYAPIPEMTQIYRADPHWNEAQVSSRLESIGVHYIEQHPGSLLRTAYWSARRLLDLTGTRLERLYAFPEGYPLWLATWSVYAFWIVLALSVAGAFTAAARRAPPAFWAVPGVILLSTVFLEGMTRYRLPADPFFVMAGALALSAAAERVRAHAGLRGAPA